MFKDFYAWKIQSQEWGEGLLKERVSMNIISNIFQRIQVWSPLANYHRQGIYNLFLTGLYFTRDWAYCDLDGDFYVVGRQDDIIRIKGVWIQVPEIEILIAVSILEICLGCYLNMWNKFKIKQVKMKYVRMFPLHVSNSQR